MIFNLFFVNNLILPWFLLLFLIIDLRFLIPAVIAQIFNPTAELAIPAGILTKEAKPEIEIHPVTVEVKSR